MQAAIIRFVFELLLICCRNSGQYCSYFYPGEDKYCDTALFFGRGVHQLTHPSNYADFSEYWYKDRTVLLKVR